MHWEGMVERPEADEAWVGRKPEGERSVAQPISRHTRVVGG